MLDINFHELEDLNTNEMFFLRQKRLQKYNQHDPASLIAKRKKKKKKINKTRPGPTNPKIKKKKTKKKQNYICILAYVFSKSKAKKLHK
jgi:hypothetical protein